jgi:hypothetical protein
METLCELHVNIHVAIMRDLLSSIGGAKVTSGENGEVGRSNHRHARRSRIPVTNHHLAVTLIKVQQTFKLKPCNISTLIKIRIITSPLSNSLYSPGPSNEQALLIAYISCLGSLGH